LAGAGRGVGHVVLVHRRLFGFGRWIRREGGINHMRCRHTVIDGILANWVPKSGISCVGYTNLIALRVVFDSWI
jgi:hypothetical protein